MEQRANVLRAMEICRFCLTEEGQLTNIYDRQPKSDTKQTVPLPLQLMACIAIEVFPNDGMPQMICEPCRIQTQHAYIFKTNCKKADDALKVYLATGDLIKPWTDDELREQREKTIKQPQPSPVAIKRQQSASSSSSTSKPSPQLHKPKKAKLEAEQTTEMVTLNYSAHINPSSSQQQQQQQQQVSSFDEDDVDEDDENSRSANGEEATSFEEVTIPDMNLEEEALLNPTLKVNQVKTDCFPCQHCERSFPLKQLLDLHEENHNRERNFTCEECGKAFFTKYDLSKHLLTHTGCKPFTCVICHKHFARESLLHRHEKTHNDVPKYLCPQCDKTFLTGEDLDAHTAKHKKKRPFQCKICQKSFVFKQGLERHELSHSNVRPHKCNYCEASFNSAIKLTRHVTSHAGLRPYPCKICGRTFLLSHHLTRHMRSHYAVNQPEVFMPSAQHKCDLCSMSFRRKDSLINHSAIHSMVNLKCVICNTEFDNVIKVKEHITTHLSDLPFPCEKCDYSFETQEQLEDHEVKHAEMEYEDQIEQEVIAEARQAASRGEGEGEDDDDDDGGVGGGGIGIGLDEDVDEEEDYSGDDIAEFTITNDMNNPEVVRRSKRVPKIKNYAEFLKDELGSDVEDSNSQGQMEEVPEEKVLIEQEYEPAQVIHAEFEDNVIKPIVRTEGTKVYTRRNVNERPRFVPQLSIEQANMAPLSKITQQQTLMNVDTANLAKVADKEIFNMKIGNKTVTVQKLLLTRDQMKAMAKEGKIEKQGNTLVLKKTPGQNLNMSLDAYLKSKGAISTTSTPARKVFTGVPKPQQTQSMFEETIDFEVQESETVEESEIN